VHSTLILGAAIPLCLMGSLMLIDWFGRSINVITLAGLAFSIGSVLDNSIVILENIYRHRTMGKGAAEAAYVGTEEVWTALLSSTITNVVVFLPIIGLKDEAGQLFRDLAIAITCTNFFSFIVALLVIPCLARILFTKVIRLDHDAPMMSAYNLWGLYAVAGWFYNLLGTILRWLINSTVRRLTVTAATIAVAFLLIFVFFPKTEYLPEGNQNAIFGLLLAPQGYSLNEFKAIGSELEKHIRPYVEASIDDYREQRIDAPPIRDFFFVAFGNAMFVFTRAKDPATASQVPNMLIDKFSKVPGVIPISSQLSIFSSDISGSRGIELDIIGPDFREATNIAMQAFLKVFQVMPEAQPRPEPGIEIGQPQVAIRPNWERAAELGLTAEAIGYGAWVLGDGAFADEYYETGKKMDLYLYSTMGAFDAISSFDSLRISTSDGHTVPLSSIGSVEFGFAPQEIRRVDQQRAVTINITPPKDISLEEAIRLVQTGIIDALKAEGAVPPGYELRIGGSSDKLAAIREHLSWDMLLALVLIYLTLVLVIKHLGHPLTILMSVPIGLTGGVLGLKALNLYLPLISPGQIQSLDVLTMLGFIILLGSVVNNPILIVEQSLNFIEQGLERHEAIVEATLSRVRPILMTTGTTVLGLMPLVVLPGAGSELYRGLGVVMFGGLVVGTVTTTVFMPCVLSLTMDFSEWVSGLLPRESISRVVPLYEDEKEED
jgi:HAE1 family hydrophobic/amphiphilic exporter-1